jgi:hypothetical protein
MRTCNFGLIRVVLAAAWVVTGVLSLDIFPQRERLGLLEKMGLQGNHLSPPLRRPSIMSLVCKRLNRQSGLAMK